jgi:hypothetical protein
MFPQIQKDAAIAADPREARAALIAKLRGDAPFITLRQDMDALALRNRETLAGGSQAVRAALADQIPLLEAVALRFFNDAAKPAPPNSRQALAGVALSAQKVLIANLMALHRVTQDEADSKAIPIQHTRSD